MDQPSSDEQSIYSILDYFMNNRHKTRDKSELHQVSMFYYIDELINATFKKWALKPLSADTLDNKPYLQTLGELHLLLAPDTIDEHLIPLFDLRYKSSTPLQQVSSFMEEVFHQAKRPAFTAHVEPSNTTKVERCSICLEDLADDSENMDWAKSHSSVITSCGHIFGGNCLSIWLSNVKTRSCPCCREDFNSVDGDCDLRWKNRGDMWRWYKERKYTILECQGRCGVTSGRYCWDDCSLEEIQAQFLMQDTFPIPPVHWAYIIMDINMALRAGAYLSTQSLEKYVKRTLIVVEALNDNIPRTSARKIKKWRREMLDEYEKLAKGSSEAKMKFCAKLLNRLHDVVEHFERVFHPELGDEYDEDFNAIDLDGLQADCGRRAPHFNTSLTLSNYLVCLRDGLRPDTILDWDDLSGLRRDQIGVVEALTKISQQTSSFVDANSMKAYLKDRIKLLTKSFDLLSKFVWERERRNFEPELVQGNSDISEALKKIHAMEKEERKKSEGVKLSRGQRKKLAKRRRTTSG
jgi:hypothetical protein